MLVGNEKKGGSLSCVLVVVVVVDGEAMKE